MSTDEDDDEFDWTPPPPKIVSRMECLPVGEIATLRARISALEGLLRECRRKHTRSADSMYACGLTIGRPSCDCGADEWNARLDAALTPGKENS